MKENSKKEYEIPQVELIDSHVEKGFTGSITSSDPIREGQTYNGDAIFS